MIPAGRALCERDAYVRIFDGEVESGTIDKKAIGAFDGQIVHRIIRQYGMKRAARFIDDITHLAIRAIMLDGFSFGIDDEDLSRTEYGQIDEVLQWRRYRCPEKDQDLRGRTA